MFNTLLADRVSAGDWNQVLPGDTCVLQGTRSQFTCEQADADIVQRCFVGDLHPALPLWGLGVEQLSASLLERWSDVLEQQAAIGDFLIHQVWCWASGRHGLSRMTFAGSFVMMAACNSSFVWLPAIMLPLYWLSLSSMGNSMRRKKSLGAFSEW